MRNRELGSTGVMVSELCLGSMTFGGYALAEPFLQDVSKMPFDAAGFAKTRRSMDVATGLALIDPVADGLCHGMHRGCENSVFL